MKSQVYLDRRCEPLRDLYADDFKRILSEYEVEFEAWLKDWKSYIKNNRYPYKEDKVLIPIPETVREYALQI